MTLNYNKIYTVNGQFKCVSILNIPIDYKSLKKDSLTETAQVLFTIFMVFCYCSVEIRYYL